ncbi:MAG: hypothetical protein WKF79_10895 [Nocardioides sp.]
MMGTGAAFAAMLLCGGLVVVLIVVVVGWLGRSLTTPDRRDTLEQATRPAAENSPLEILRRRYATGEIDEDEYFRRLSGLSA